MIEDLMAVAMAGAAKASNVRTPMDRQILTSFVNASAKHSRGDLKAKYAQTASDPAYFPTATRKGADHRTLRSLRDSCKRHPPEQTEIGPTRPTVGSSATVAESVDRSGRARLRDVRLCLPRRWDPPRYEAGSRCWAG
jgi:hypothetical protein